jgi:molybdenum cofactor synthesis domain-containing protein
MLPDWEENRMRAAIVTVSDRGSRGEQEDLSGPEIRKALQSIGAEIVSYVVIPDERILIEGTLVDLVDLQMVDLVLTTGGTGLSPRDVTPEATRSVIEKEVPGIQLAMIAEGMKKTPRAMLSRAVAGVRKETLIVNLPGSPKAVREGLDVITPVIEHAIAIIKTQPTDH